ncbi:Alkaline phosphatase synthesis sensor protein phoR [uncultured Clostridium sp.]|uniref:ATP-binding protein n=1 Tax=uncultured Clostridium sp. TaxID=59620 RepID=UPI0008231600|nr:ATP-binding protein [uncultured Clostridium sp.]SCJ49805.1 Alkaline phosphatase synthesis sensor protein phoR [uncultured Clostridium sp.]
MKKRIIISSLATVIFSLILVCLSFIELINIHEIDRAKGILSVYNELFIKEVEGNDLDFSKFRIDDNQVRFTIIDIQGNVLYDSENEGYISENHIDREEIQKAFINGEGSSVRYSKTSTVNLVYYATKLNDNMVVRSSVPTSAIMIFLSGNLKYYIFIIIIVAVLALGLSIKLTRIIIYPIKELEEATAKILNGDLNNRAKVYNNDEIGSLAKSFNRMADELQIKINDSYDKQNKLEAILESMDSGVIAIDNYGKIMLINNYSKKLFGLKGEVIGKKIEECIIDYDLLQFAKNIPEIDSKEIKLFHPVQRELKVKKAPIINGNISTIGIVITISDITDIKRLENMRSQFVANVSHELKTPLTSIKGFSETLKYVDDNETRKKFLDIINKEAERLSRLIHDILILSNIENMKVTKVDNFKPVEVLQDVIDVISAESTAKHIEITMNDNYKEYLSGNRDKFYQLSMNLVDNAVKYSKENGKVKVELFKKNNYFSMVVEDDGIGIPKDDLPRIFERFYRVDKSRSTKGTGLGLAIVKHIVKLFNGEVDVYSTPGKGTKFIVKIRI